MSQRPDPGHAAACTFRVKISADGIYIKSTIDGNLFSLIRVYWYFILLARALVGVGRNRDA